MAYPKLLRLRLLLLLALTVFVSGLHAQELEDIVQESEAEDEEVRELSGVEIEGTGEESLGGRLRFPKGEEVSEIRFAQDRQIDPKTYAYREIQIFLVSLGIKTHEIRNPQRGR